MYTLIEYLEKGIHNLLKHIDNLKNVFGLNVIVGINKYITDTDKEIEYLKNKFLRQKHNEWKILSENDIINNH